MIEVERLLKVFSHRPERYRLLEKGMELAALGRFAPRRCTLLEVGCGIGDAAAYLAKKHNSDVTGLDISAELISAAQERHRDLTARGVLNFRTGNAEELPFSDQTFDGIISEAAFSPLPRKKEAVSGYYRVLKKGGRVLVNDFAIRRQTEISQWAQVAQIPCFREIDTIQRYKELFEAAGFRTVHCCEEYGELVRIYLWLSKSCSIPVTEISVCPSGHYSSNQAKTCCDNEKGRGSFFKEAQLTYCQLVFEK